MSNTILVVDDEESIRVSLEAALTDEETQVRTASSGVEALRILDSDLVDLVLLDQKLKESEEDGIEVLREIRSRHREIVAIIMTAYGRIDSAVEAIKLGAFQYLTKPVDLDHLKVIISSALSTAHLQRHVDTLQQDVDNLMSPTDVFGPSRKTQELLERVELAASSPTSTVLIRGETGVGKELVARQIHRSSPVAKGPFVDFNCSAVPENLIESELFGHEKGAFTDAKGVKRGLFEMADRGSLFLDEIGEMPMPMQAKLLRVLETKSFRKLGSTVDCRVQVRVIAATNKDLFEEVQKGAFREDLYYRLDVIPIDVPPLRERPEDIPALAEIFVERFSRDLRRSTRKISDGAMEILRSYAWPGNVRELKNMIERLVLLTQSTEILPEHLPASLSGSRRRRTEIEEPRLLFAGEELLTLEEVERAAIVHTLERLKGNKTKAAEVLGISRQTLRSKIRDGDGGGE
ncbi:MAG: response regulator [Candidatus Eisenbacteria bacterium]|nr:response regulator [Candidatus Latescibacterota bacterium]MBD3302967.1 response regulator [Candidatus Eisenbacteria bacterium]